MRLNLKKDYGVEIFVFFGITEELEYFLTCLVFRKM